MSTVVGTVNFIVGQAYAIKADGTQRLLMLGDDVYADEVIRTTADSKVEISMSNGELVALENGQNWLVSAETYSSTDDYPVDESVVTDDIASVNAIQQAILEGLDPTLVAEDTAAGNAAPGEGENEGSTFELIERTAVEGNPQAGFETTGITQPQIETVQEPGLLELVDVVTSTPSPVLAKVDIKDNSGNDDMISSIDDQTQTVLKGTIEAGGSITALSVTDAANNSVAYSNLVVQPDGSWTATVDVTSLNDGTLTVTLDAQDAQGNAAPQVSDTIEKDTVTSATVDIKDNSGNDDMISSIDDQTQTVLKGTIEAGGSITALSVTDAANNSVAYSNLVVQPDGSWTATVDVTSLNDGTLAVTLDAQDAQGNAAPQVSDTIEKVSDTNPPVAVDDLTIVSGGLSSEYYGYVQSSTQPNLTTVNQVMEYVAANDAEITFTSTRINYGYTDTNDNGKYDSTENASIKGDNLADGVGVDGIATHLQGFLKQDAATMVGTSTSAATDGIVHIKGLLSIDTTGSYTFNALHDDGFVIFVDGKDIFNYDGITPPKNSNLTVPLDAGLHTVEIYYWDQAGAYIFDLQLNDASGENIWIADNLLSVTSDGISTYEDTPVTINLIANDFDPDDNLDPSTIAIQDDPLHGNLVINSDGTVVYTPVDNFNGVETFTYTVKDTAGNESNVATVSINVTPYNTVIGTDGANELWSTAGNDILSGLDGDDTFFWPEGSGSGNDIVTDFAVYTNVGDEKDVLDLHDLLQGVPLLGDASDLTSYLHFVESGNDTILEVKTDGVGAVDQTIVLQDVDLGAGGGRSDVDIIQQLLDNNQLIVE